jgi:hypothetical protein
MCRYLQHGEITGNWPIGRIPLGICARKTRGLFSFPLGFLQGKKISRQTVIQYLLLVQRKINFYGEPAFPAFPARPRSKVAIGRGNIPQTPNPIATPANLPPNNIRLLTSLLENANLWKPFKYPLCQDSAHRSFNTLAKMTAKLATFTDKPLTDEQQSGASLSRWIQRG